MNKLGADKEGRTRSYAGMQFRGYGDSAFGAKDIHNITANAA